MEILTWLLQFEVKGVSDAAYRGETIYKWEMKVTAWQQVLTSILRPILQSEVPDSDVDTGEQEPNPLFNNEQQTICDNSCKYARKCMKGRPRKEMCF